MSGQAEGMSRPFANAETGEQFAFERWLNDRSNAGSGFTDAGIEGVAR